MENKIGTVRVHNIQTAAGMLKTVVILDNIRLDDPINEIREHLEIDKEIDDVENFEYEVIEAVSEDTDTINKIRKVLAKYFEKHSNGTPSETYLGYFSAQCAIDEIVDIIGEY